MGRIDNILTTSIKIASLFIPPFFTSLMTMLPVDKNIKKQWKYVDCLYAEYPILPVIC